jgi:hypothetical protein
MVLYVNNLNLILMSKNLVILNEFEKAPHFQPESKILRLVASFAVWGIIVTILWLLLFVAGLMVDSSYYRSAISYGFAGFSDWIMASLTFTFSNVILLSFMSGLLGGITSKMVHTKGFRINNWGYSKADTYKIENPFISAFRGMFVFIAILFMQYVSTFSDLGAISKIPQEENAQVASNYEKLYSSVAEKTKDTVVLDKLKLEIAALNEEGKMAEPDTAIINKIIMLKASVKQLSRKTDQGENLKNQKRMVEASIVTLRRTLKVPSNSDFSGIGLSSFSYFKFAVICSFLAFAFGYDPSLFAEFIGKIFKKLDSDNPESNPDQENNQR